MKGVIVFAALLALSTAKPYDFFGGSNDFFSSFFSRTKAPVVVSSSAAPVTFSVQPVSVTEEVVFELSAVNEEEVEVTTVPTEQLVETTVSLTSEVPSVTERSDAYTAAVAAVEVLKSSFVSIPKIVEEPNVDIFARFSPVVEKSKPVVQTVEVLDYPVYFNLTDYLRKCKRIVIDYFKPKTVTDEPTYVVNLITEGTTEVPVSSTTTTLAPTTVEDVEVTTEVERYITTLQPKVETTTFEVRETTYEIERTTPSLEITTESVISDDASVDERTTLAPTTVNDVYPTETVAPTTEIPTSPSSLATEKSTLAPKKIDFVGERFREALVAKSKPGKPSEFLITFTSVDRNNTTTSMKHFLDYLRSLKK